METVMNLTNTIWAAAAASILSGCGASTPPVAAPAGSASEVRPATASAAPAEMTFVLDDFAAARALSTQKQLPLFVEAFAPW